VVLDFYCCSHQVLNTFPSHCQINLLSQHFPQVPNVFPKAPAFVQYACCLLGTYIGESILKTYMLLCLERIFSTLGESLKVS